MSAAEDAIINFFADAIQNRNVSIQILAGSVGLYAPHTAVECTVYRCQEVRGSQIIGVHDNYYIVGYSVNGIHCHCQCFGFGAVFIVGYQQSDRQGTQELVGGRLHLVGDNDDIKHFFRIFLSQETAYGRDDYPVFFISREEYDETS